METSKAWVGISIMIAYAIITACSSLFIHHTNSYIPPMLSAFYAFLFCLIIYGIFATNLIKKIKIIRQFWFIILILNITTAIAWIFTFLALKYIPAELYLFIYLCAMPISTSFLYKEKIIKSVIMLIALTWLMLAYSSSTIGCLLAFTGGVAGTVYSIYSKRLISDFTTVEILSVRFYLLVLLTFILNLYFHSFQIMQLSFYANFVLISFISIILPLTLFQYGIKHMKVSLVMCYLPLAPIICYALNIVMKIETLDYSRLIAVLILFSTMIFDFSKKRGQKNESGHDWSQWRHWISYLKSFNARKV